MQKQPQTHGDETEWTKNDHKTHVFTENCAGSESTIEMLSPAVPFLEKLGVEILTLYSIGFDESAS